MLKRKLICLIISILTVLNLSACSNIKISVNTEFDKEAIYSKLENGKVLAENDNYILQWVSKNASITLIDKKTGVSWGATPIKEGEATVDEFGMPIKKHPQLESAIVLEYVNASNDAEEQQISYTSCVKEGNIIARPIENGVMVEYYFEEASIMIPVDYVLRNDSVAVSIDAKKIQENDHRVISVAICPYWCSAENDTEEAYIFYPSGSGAVINAESLSQAGKIYSAEVYGDDPVKKTDDLFAIQKAVRMPVFGAKSGNNATCAIIEEAAESAVIETKMGSTAIGYSAVYAKFQIRGYSPNVAEFMNGTKKQLNIYSRNMADSKMTVGFYPLVGEKSDYSGMAETYRNYLNLNNKTKSEDALDITFVGGMMINKSFAGIPYECVLSATTLSQVKDILVQIKSETNTSINARLVGFGSRGLDRADYCGNYKLNKVFGSLSDLNALSGYCKENDINLFFDFDIITLKNSDKGYSAFFDTAHSALGKIADLYDYDVATRSRVEETKYNLLKRELIFEASNKLLKKIDGWDIGGISLDSLSNIAYSDYSTKKSVSYYVKGGIDEDVSSILEEFSNKYQIAVSDANDYAALKADVIYNAPTESSKEQLFTQDIPFYQMVFKGYVPLSSESVNMASNTRNHILKSIESGSRLSYTLINDYHNEFIDYNGYEFFGSRFADVCESIYENFFETCDYYESINSAHIVKHSILENGLRETVFDNGIKVYVNYSNKLCSSPLGEVAAKQFIWGRE